MVSPGVLLHPSRAREWLHVGLQGMAAPPPVMNPPLLPLHKRCELALNPLQIFVFWFKNAVLHLD